MAQASEQATVDNASHDKILWLAGVTLPMTPYAAGLLVLELVAHRWDEIDGERTTIRVTQGKGARDRHTKTMRPLYRRFRPGTAATEQ